MNPPLTQLDLSGNDIDTEGSQWIAESLKVNIKLTELNLRSNSIGDSGCQWIGEALEVNNSITKLDLCSNCIGADGCYCIGEALKVNTSLAQLYLDGNSIGDEGGRCIGEALKVNTSITLLRLGNSSIGAEGSNTIGESLKVNSRLTQLDLSYNGIGAEGCKCIGEALKANKSITKINLCYNGIGAEGCNCIGEALKVNKFLTQLDLSRNGVGDEGGKCVGEALKVNSSITELHLSNNNIGDEGGRCIGEALAVNASITQLDLGANRIGEEAFKYIGEALKVNKFVTKLDLSGNGVGGKVGKCIGEALKVNSSITELKLGDSRIDAEGCKQIGEALKVNKSLTQLFMDKNNIGDEGGQYIGEALKVNTSITELHLGNNRIGDASCNLIGDGLKVNTALVQLYLDDNAIGDEGCKHIGEALKVNTSLADLYLHSNKVGDAGCKHIGDGLKVNTSLAQLYLAFNSIGDQGCKHLGEALKVNLSIQVVLGDLGLGEALKSDLPPEICELSNDEVIKYLRSTASSGSGKTQSDLLSVWRSKLMFVGYGEAGKTSLLRCLRNESFQEKSLSTDGIDIIDWKVDHPTLKEVKMDISMWDFAGQEDYYATHQLFLSSRCIYLLVWNPRGRSFDEGVEFWLKSLSSIGDTDRNREHMHGSQPASIRVIIVATRKSDGNAAVGVNMEELSKQFPRLSISFQHVDSKTKEGIDNLRKELYGYLADVGKIELPSSWIQFSTKVIEERKTQPGIVTTDHVLALGRSVGIESEMVHMAVKVFHNWGLLLHYPLNELVDFCVLSPQWLSNALRAVITNTVNGVTVKKMDEHNSVSGKQAVLTVGMLKQIWKEKVNADNVSELLALMKKFELAFELPNSNILVPALLMDRPSASQLASLQAFITEATKTKDTRTVHQEMILAPFLPADFCAKFIFRTHKFTVEQDKSMHCCWKYFMLLGKNGQWAKLEINDKTVIITVVGSAPDNLAGLLADKLIQLVQRYQNVTYEHFIYCPHATCGRQKFNVQDLRKKRKPEICCPSCDNDIPIADLLQSTGQTFDSNDSLSPSGPAAGMNLNVKTLTTGAHAQQLASQIQQLKSEHKLAEGIVNSSSNPNQQLVQQAAGKDAIQPVRTTNDNHLDAMTVTIAGVTWTIGQLKSQVQQNLQDIDSKIKQLFDHFDKYWFAIALLVQTLSVPSSTTSSQRETGTGAVIEKREQFERGVLNLLQLLTQRYYLQFNLTGTLSISQTALNTPRMFYMVPYPMKKWYDKIDSRQIFKQLISDEFEIQLVCECPGQFHKSSLKQIPSFQCRISKETWIKLAPYVLFTLKALGVELSPECLTALEQLCENPFADGIYPELKEKQVGLQPIAGSRAEKESIGLKAFSDLLVQHTPSNLTTFPGLTRVLLDTGEMCWMCSEHERQYKSAAVSQSVKVGAGMIQHGRRTSGSSRPTSATVTNHQRDTVVQPAVGDHR